MRELEKHVVCQWRRAQDRGERYLPHEFVFRVLRSGDLEPCYQIDPADSWMVAACEADIPLVVPGWEDSTLGNMFAARCTQGELSPGIVKSGTEYMMALADWFARESQRTPVGLFQIGGGIAGDFPICVVPMLRQDLKRHHDRLHHHRRHHHKRHH